MDVIKEIEELKRRVNMLSNTVSQAGKNQTAVTGKVDDTSNRVNAITPYTDSYTAYIGDDDAHFFDVPQGILSVSVVDSEGHFIDYTLEREGNIVSVYFDEPLENVATVTISVQ